jgi:hypothetical protein
MISLTRLMITLGWTVFIIACVYVGYVSEMLKDSVSSMHRVVLMLGFLVGAAAVARWVMVLDIQRNLRRIRATRSKRTDRG